MKHITQEDINRMYEEEKAANGYYSDDMSEKDSDGNLKFKH